MTTLDQERNRRETAWNQVLAEESGGVLSAQRVRELGLYGAAQGIWVDKKEHTGEIRPDGVAVGIRLTGRHYPDDKDEHGVIYHYPNTMRQPGRDASEVRAMKNAQELDLPIFITSEVPGKAKSRQVQRGWVIDHDDKSQLFLITFDPDEARSLQEELHSTSEFMPTQNRKRTSVHSSRPLRSSFFKFGVFQRFQGQCPLTGCAVPEMLQAAHVIPVENGGSDDLRNGLLLQGAVHLALDAGLWAIQPRSLQVVTRPTGPTAVEMGMTTTDLSSASAVPHRDALEFRYQRFLHTNKIKAEDVELDRNADRNST